MYLLRTIRNDRDGNYLVDSWYEATDTSELIKKIITLNPDEYQCFEADDITNEIYSDVEATIEDMEKEGRRLQYEELKKEFDP